MFELLHRILIISLVVNFVNAIPDGASIPFILIKFKDGLELPREVKLRIDYKQKMIKTDFGYSDDKKQAFYCPAETSDQWNKIKEANEIFRREKNKIGDEISENCLFEKKVPKKMHTTLPQCQAPFQPTMMKDLIMTQTGKRKRRLAANPVLCGASDLGQRLKFGYEKYPFKISTLGIYKVCYNAQKVEMLYTLHQIKTPLLFNEFFLKKEVVKKPKTMATNKLMNMPEIDFEQVKLKLEELQESSTNPKFKIQLLVPLEDFPFLTWKIPVFHYVNASLINEELQQCWNKIHDELRENVIQTKRLLSIYTRTFEYFETSSARDEYVDEIQIPSIWVKLVHDMNYYKTERKAVAIIANNKRDDALDEMWTKYNCEQNLCQNYIKRLFPNVIAKDIRCCRVATDIQHLFGLNLTFKGVLDIEGLIDPVSDSSYQKSTTKAPRKLQQITSG